MEGTLVFAVFALFGCCVQAQDTLRQQTTFTMPPTTEMPVPSTAISLSPQTSISVHHTIVRNQPAYPYPYTESPIKRDGSEDSSYYYTYEDVSEEASKMGTSTMTTPTTLSTTKPVVKSFWNSQKALLDQRRKESSQKFKPTYTKPSNAKENKPAIEFKVREKPKFGQSNKYKSSFTPSTTTKNPEVTSTMPIESSTSTKAVKTDFTLNLPISKLPQKDVLKNSLKTLNSFTNQIVGRVGEIPAQANTASQIQSPIRAQSTIVNSFGSAGPSKLDNSVANVQFIDNIRKLQQDIQNAQALRNNLQQQQALLSNLKSQPLLQPQLNLNPQPLSNLNQNTQPILNLNNQQQPLQNSVNNPSGNTFIAATAPIGTAARSAATNGQPSQASSLLQRLGALGLNTGGNSGLSNAIMGRDGGGSGVTLNLGPVSDPLSVFLRLLSLIPRPLLDLNGRIFFGIELGKNAGIVSGSAGGGKPAFNG